MAQFGEKLKAEREARGVALEEISVQTRVSVRLLEAIESENFDLLPGGLFNVSFIRQYCRCVGLDEDEIVAEFNEVARPRELDVSDTTSSSDGSVEAHERGATLAENVTEYFRHYGRFTVAALVAVLLVTIAAMLDFGSSDTATPEPLSSIAPDARDPAPADAEPQQGSSSVRAASAVQTAPSAASPPVADSKVDSEQTNAAPLPSPAASIPLIVEISVTAKVWIQAVADGERVFENIFEEGETKSIAAHDFVRLVVGNAAGLTVAVNGETMPPIGPSGHVRRVVVTPTGMEIDRIEPNPLPGRDAAREQPLETRAFDDRIESGSPSLADSRLLLLTASTLRS